ncbi:MAG: FAD-dependent oxidoreductase [Porticoccaceae bacterium]|jgi:2,4-dienoyl-CoA reductase (NADPH2)|nr:FAD-dependent oxidoreductase [Porticoccaceae bacterium]MBT5003776.1 FAD-dependent oxidoreductase [Porticoccaceae bacterium]MBT6693916.1 FAD-dependent oxidoreductase [Porticoccaceae bacterium]MBT6799929.1 FAD-dependent oxidoreductase [Porticoccaceae bacterium]MBT7167483.1 FAD-dependent oxidoreductase [Porticoccaceae bacterium]
MKYQKLLSSGSIGGLTLKNRIVLAAMGSNYAGADGHATEKLQAYYEERAKGGVGLIILETSAVSWPAGASMPYMLGFSKDEFIPDLQSLTNRVHKHGAKIAAQLNHSGKVAQEDTIAGRLIPVPSIPDKQRSDLMPLLSSAELSTFIKGAGPDGKGPRYEVLSTTLIKVEVQHFAAAAKRAKQAGFDAVEIHAGHGYLISSFLSPAVNKRTDDYGGSTENRSRLLVEIIQAVRAEVGQHFPILVRLDAKEYRIDNGIVLDDFLITAKLAEQAGADALDISAYGNSSKSIAFTEAPLVHEPGGFIPFARLAKKAVSIPIIAVGRIELQQGENGLAAGDFDFVAMGRKLLADPDLPNKVDAGTTGLIRPCIYCYICVSQIFINQPMKCAVNASLGNEYLDKNIIYSTALQKKTLVIGSGPSGMEAARLLALRGHRVSIWEKDKDLGGTVRVAALAYEPNWRLISYLKNSLDDLGVDIILNKKATAEQIAAEAPDQVIIATGAIRTAPDIKGNELRHVFDGEQLRGLLFGSDAQVIKKLSLFEQVMLTCGRWSQLLRHIGALRLLSRLWLPMAKKITIIGGDLVGLELAEFLVARGRKVQVLEPSPTLGINLSIVRRSQLIHQLKEHGAELFTRCEISEITQSGVQYQMDGKAHISACGQVIIAMGAEENLSLYEQIGALGLPVKVIGDCAEVGYIHGAIQTAREAVMSL